MPGLGGGFLVRGAVAIAARMGVSTLFIGLVLVGFGTSVPEFATSVRAALEGSAGIAIGNIVGSNLFNILGIIGITALVSPMQIPRNIVVYDVWIMVGATVLLFWFAFSGSRISRFEGAVFLALYLCYLGFLGFRSVGHI